MIALRDSSVLIAALAPDEERHAESLALLMQGGNAVHAHAILETFSTLTGGRLGVKVDPHLAARFLNETILPRVRVVELGSAELMAALQQARQRGVRGGAVYDFMHLVAARKAGVEFLYTINCDDRAQVEGPGHGNRTVGIQTRRRGRHPRGSLRRARGGLNGRVRLTPALIRALQRALGGEPWIYAAAEAAGREAAGGDPQISPMAQMSGGETSPPDRVAREASGRPELRQMGLP